MTDMNILIIGVIVFGLMFVGLVLTVLEFRQLSDDNIAECDSKSPSDTSESP
jgi:hypothetical protein